LKQGLEVANSPLSDVINVSLFLAKADEFSKMNNIYLSYLSIEPPRRTVMVTGLLQPERPVLMECVAYEPQDSGYKSGSVEENN